MFDHVLRTQAFEALAGPSVRARKAWRTAILAPLAAIYEGCAPTWIKSIFPVA
jgi:hypothetical protein